MRRRRGPTTLLLLGVVVLLAVAAGVLAGTGVILPDAPLAFPVIAGVAALACLLILRLRSGPGGPRP